MAERAIRRVKIEEVAKKDAAYEVTRIKYVIPSDNDEPNREYVPKLNAPSVGVCTALSNLGHFMGELCAVPPGVNFQVRMVDWNVDRDNRIFVRFGGTLGYGVEYKTRWFLGRNLPEKCLGQINNLAISAFQMVDADSVAQGELEFPKPEENEEEETEPETTEVST